MHKRVIQGSAHVVIIVVAVLLIAGALGVVFYRNFLAKKDSGTTPQAATTTTQEKKKPSTISEINGTDMLRYTNNTYGFQFDFPKQISGTTGCHATNEWYDNYGNKVAAPVTSYISDDGIADMTVLEGEHEFTITQKRAPLFTVATYGSDQRQYNSDCKMVDVTQSLLASDNSPYTDWRSWQVYKLDSPTEIATVEKNLRFLPNGDNVKTVNYSLGKLENGRQAVTYTFTYKEDTGGIGGSATQTWYYPEQKLLVHIGLGQAMSFMKPHSTDSYYIDDIVSSFKVL